MFCKVKETLKIVDLTGAGDLYLQLDFFTEYINNKSMKESLEKELKWLQKLFKL